MCNFAVLIIFKICIIMEKISGCIICTNVSCRSPEGQKNHRVGNDDWPENCLWRATPIIMHSAQKPHSIRLSCMRRVLLKYSQKTEGKIEFESCDGACLDMYLFIRSYVWWNGKTRSEWESGLTVARESFVGAQKKWCYKNFDIPTSNTNICSAPAENRVCVCACTSKQ